MRPPRDSVATERPPPTSPQPPPRTPGAPPARMREGGGGSPGARGSPATARARADPPVEAQRLPGAPAARRPQFPSELLPRKGADYKKRERPASMLRRVGPQHSTKARPPTSDLHPRNLGAVLDGLGRCTSSCRTLTSETQEWRLATQPTSCATPQHRNRRTQFPLPQAGYTSASGIRRDRSQPPLLRLPIGCGNQQVPGGGDGEATNEISGGQGLGRAGQC